MSAASSEVGAADLVPIIIGYDGDAEAYYVHPTGDGDESEGASNRFFVRAPADLWADLTTASAAYDRALKALVEYAELDDGGRKLTPCASWEGEPARPERTWWAIRTPGGGHLGTYTGEVEAHLFMAELPDVIHLYEYGTIRTIIKSDLTVVKESGWSYGPGECQRCGWPYSDHDDASSCTNGDPS